VTETTTETEPAASSTASKPDSGPTLPSPRRRASKRLWLVFAVLAAAFTFLLVEGLGNSLDYFDTINQAFAQRATLGTTTFRLEGTVVPGTIQPTATGTSFSIAQGSHVVHVVNTGSPPQLFQPSIPVVVVGHFTTATSTNFASSSILVKHTSVYIAQHPGRVKANNGSVR
jgi:cytochrome c-type biogenesis protein CcmE